jgi:peptidoglycan/xylan/chitin deacetylase (PgdA/CDA1 family)
MLKHNALLPILALRALLVLAAYAVVPLLAPAPRMPAAVAAAVPLVPTMKPTATPSPTVRPTPRPTSTPRPTPDIAALVLARADVPILCYHHIRDWEEDEAEVDQPYIVPPAMFAEQMDFLDQHGYHPISPDQLVAYLTGAGTLPERPVLITFDDSDDSQWTNALPILQKHNFIATFFIMTVVLDKPNYLSSEQVQALDRMGMTIGAHTWDHHQVTKYSADDWKAQVAEPTAYLAELTGHPIKYFAYPYGLWNEEAIPHIKRAGFAAAFQLESEMDTQAPLFTLRRMIANSFWTTEAFQEAVAEGLE